MCLYFNSEELWDTLRRMALSLKPDGILIIGAEEHLPQGYESIGLRPHHSCPGAFVKESVLASYP